MTLVLFGDHISPEGLLSIARRHGSEDRVRVFCERVDAGEAQGEEIPGDFAVIRPWLKGRDALRLALYYLGLMPIDTDTFVQTTRRADGSAWSEVVPVPAPSDLDETGTCRCGCGYTAQAS